MAESTEDRRMVADGRFTAAGARIGQRFAAVGLVACMAIGSIAMWLGIPVLCLYVASKLYPSQEPNFGVYTGVLLAIILLMAAMGKLLGWLGRTHSRLVDDAMAKARQPRPWLRSMRGERNPHQHSSVLDVVMLVSVSLAMFAMAVWFFGFAGSSLPGA